MTAWVALQLEIAITLLAARRFCSIAHAIYVDYTLTALKIWSCTIALYFAERTVMIFPRDLFG